MGEGATDPCFKRGMFGRHEAAGWKPGPEEPVQSAHFEIDPAAKFDLGHLHRGKFNPADFASWNFLGDYQANVVAAVLVGGNFGVVPHVAEPLSVGQTMTLRPLHQLRDRIYHRAFAKRIMDPDVSDASRRQAPESNLEAIWVFARFQPVEEMSMSRIGGRNLPVLAPFPAEELDVKSARRHFEALLETSGEIGRRVEPARKGDVGERGLLPSGPVFLRHQAEGALQPQAFHEFVERFANQRSEDAMKVKRRKTRGPGHHLQLERLIEVLKDEVDGPVDPVHVVERLVGYFFSQDL